MTKDVFVNRILNLKRIKYIGLDMDHTLIRYKTRNFEALVYRYVIDELVDKRGYNSLLKHFKFNFEAAIRGLVIDCKNGNIIKVSRYGAIRQCAHGTRQMDYAEQRQLYRSTYVDLSDPNYMVIDTAFSISFCVLYAQLIDAKYENPKLFRSYAAIAMDVLAAVDRVHAEGKLKKHISLDLSEYVIKDPAVVAGIRRYIEHGKKFFIATNSDYHYTNLLLEYSINPFLKAGETWQDLFEFVITLADKPRFFYDKLRFLRIDTQTQCMINHPGSVTPGVYQGGNATKFADDLGLNGDEILYVGDHIYGDILRLKKDCNWRTALVVEELGGEISGQRKAMPIEKEIIAAMEEKSVREERYIDLYTRRIDENTDAYDVILDQIQTQISSSDRHLALLLQKQHACYNVTWDRVFRVGAEESYFAFQVECYACIYMEKLSDLLNNSPFTYFRAKRRQLPHDLEIS